MQSLASIVLKNHRDLAFVVGNGINRYENKDASHSWETLLLQLWHKLSPDAPDTIPKGITLTEFYDVIDLVNESRRSESLQKEFCRLLESWKPQPHHKAFIEWARRHGNPVLTTNFESTLSNCINANFFQMDPETFTDFYPWASYYADQTIADPAEAFAIWHINGMQRYPRSIRLGLTHYMGSVERARSWIHKGNESRLFSGKNTHRWKGHKTWLHVIFNKPLVIFGLQLDPTEVFLRWLLIERAKYFRMFPQRRKRAWYVSTSKNRSGHHLFLSSLGIEIVNAQNYHSLYEAPWS